MENTHGKFNILNTMLPCRALKMEGGLSFLCTRRPSSFNNTMWLGLGTNHGKSAVKDQKKNCLDDSINSSY